VRAVEQTSPPRGFSLVELLVALAVVAIMLGSVALAVRQPASRALSTEFTRFEEILQVSADRAASLGREHRMLLGPTGYRVVNGCWPNGRRSRACLCSPVCGPRVGRLWPLHRRW
jgi:prepilin-type N-terminal cleavage/methylation domain-containing protein